MASSCLQSCLHVQPRLIFLFWPFGCIFVGPYSSSSSSSSRDESPRAIHSSRSHATASSSPKRRRLDHSYSRSHGSSRDRRRSAAGGNRRTSSCSSSSSDRSSRSSASSGHRERLERQKDVEPQQRLARRRSKAESSDSDNANSSDGMNGGSVRAADRPLTTTFDVERIPYDAPDHLDTLRPMVHTCCTYCIVQCCIASVRATVCLCKPHACSSLL